MTQSEIKSIISEHPGILQSELHKYTDVNRGAISDQVMGLYIKKEIRKEKWKNSNKLYIKE